MTRGCFGAVESDLEGQAGWDFSEQGAKNLGTKAKF